MKKLAIKTIRIYQSFFSVALKNLLGTPRFCRFDVTCSEYAIFSIERHGLLKGSTLTLARLLKCQPFYKGAI